MSEPKGRLHVVVEDLDAASGEFSKLAGEYSQGMPYDGAQCPFGCPRGGTELFDKILENTLRLIGQVHVEIGQAMGNHGVKLGQAAARYASSEAQALGIIADVFLAADTAPLPPDQPLDGGH
ncbi:DUF6317 family protein [Actinoallomurus rhizosphaericola]|uniref:DUF6317 family protein n=1 Tax=Actinoallomurus rhizosphaericola TaxID=2952536 RepID=UPI002090C0D7|nr:DUF6317 family protein [Actinoallomurus rhizosphaericola]MCO5994603.1 DUF6317 family protein [Actinoallomurus rhizosphaericola]